MKYYILLIISIIFSSCKEEKDENGSINTKATETALFISTQSKELKIQDNILYFKNKKFTGILYMLDNNQRDTLSIEGYSDGILNGVSKKWFSNAQLMEMRHYTNGQKNGKQIAYFENGKKKFEFIAIDDHYEGELLEWNIDGSLIHLATYKNGQEEGTQKMWYDNGKIRANYVMLNGKRYGLLGTKNCKNVSDSIFIVK